jgi:hypothetical protein
MLWFFVLGRLPHKTGNDGCEHNRYEDGKKETRGCVGGWLRVVRVMLMHLGVCIPEKLNLKSATSKTVKPYVTSAWIWGGLADEMG